MFRVLMDYFFGLDEDEQLDPAAIIILALFLVAMVFGILTIATIRGWG